MCATRSPSSRSTPAPRRSPSRFASATSAPAAARSSAPPAPSLPSVFLLQGQRAAVDAEALPAFVRRAVVEDVAEVGVAGFADDLGAAHEEAVVGPQLDVLEVRRLGEAGPAGARVELGVGGEQLGAAADAAVHPLA